MRFRNGYGRTEPQGPLDDVGTTARLQVQEGTAFRTQPMLIRTHDAHHVLHFSFYF
jgi:hypothetical protein